MYNFPIQSAAASMMYEALIQLERQLPKGAELRLTVHDEVVLNVQRDHTTLQAAIDCTRNVMEQTFQQIEQASQYPDVVRHYYPDGWRCPSECHIGLNWRQLKCEDDAVAAVEAELKLKLNVKTS